MKLTLLKAFFLVLVLILGMAYEKQIVKVILPQKVILKKDTFMMKSVADEKNVLLYMFFLKFTHPYESCAQMSYESANFKYPPAIRANNYGGFAGKKFDHWTECIEYAKEWQTKRGLKKNMNFYVWLSGTNYHNTPDSIYNPAVMSIEASLRRKYPERWTKKILNQ